MAEADEGISNDSNVFASLMPNLFNRLQHCNDTVSEQEFQEIHRLLSLAKTDDDLNKTNLSMNEPLIPLSRQRETDDESPQEEVKKKPSSLINADYPDGKENAVPEKFPQRNKPSRRERSSRVTTHRKPFVVDIRNFGSILNNNGLGKCKKPQDVHAFWEAAEEREASEAIMCKLRGQNDEKSGNGDPALRRVGMRRKNSRRTTTRLRRFALQLPACAEQVQSLDEEQLEEEDATEESSFTFLTNPEFRPQNHTLEQSNATKYNEPAPVASSVQLAEKNVEIVDLDGAGEVSGQEEEDILSDGNSPLLNLQGTGQCVFGLAGIIASDNVSDRIETQSQGPEVLAHAPSLEEVKLDSQNKIVAEDIDNENELEMKATPYNRNIATKKTPFTSPTPPSNPLAALGLRKDGVIEDVSKRRLYFDEDNMNSVTLELELSGLITQVSPGLKNPTASSDAPEAQVEVSHGLHNPSAYTEASQAHVDLTSIPDVMIMHEENVELAENTNRKTPDVAPMITTKSPKKHATKKANAKRKRVMDDRRHSLIGAGTKWTEGQRRSTRIRSRPLEWWRGERFLRGRVHNSLPTVIGIKYSSLYPGWPKPGTKAPRFKVESYVSEEFAKKVEFAALY